MLPLMTLPSLIRTELLLSIRKTCYMDRPGIESCVAGNKTYASGVVCIVAEQGVCLQQRGGDFARAPWHVIPVKGLHQIHGHWGSSGRRLERRWATRYSFRADLEIEWGSAVLRGSTRDISTSGMFIEAVDPLWVGAALPRG